MVASSIINNEILKRKFVVRYPQLYPIGDELDGAILICAINIVLAIQKKEQLTLHAINSCKAGNGTSENEGWSFW